MTMKKIIRIVPLLLIITHIIFFNNFYRNEFEYKMYSLVAIFIISTLILVNSLKGELEAKKKTTLIVLSVFVLISLMFSFYELR